jgi:hypothetical protein
MSTSWIPRTPEDAYRRAAGRRRYQAQRQKSQRDRQVTVLAVLARIKWQRSYGIGSKLAAHFKVHRATICRDFDYLIQWRTELTSRVGSRDADQIVQALLDEDAHPKNGYSFQRRYINGVGGIEWIRVSHSR